MLLVGSQAARFRFPDARCGDAFDVWATEEEFSGWKISAGIDESRITSEGDNKKQITANNNTLVVTVFPDCSPESHFIRANKNETITTVDGFTELRVARPSTLYLIKKSHIYSSKDWHKHILDMHFLAEKVSGIELSKEEVSAFTMLRDLFLASEKKFKSMLVSDQEFFDRYDNAYIRVYPHDKLHEVTCYYGKPLYRGLKKEASMAYIAKSKFDQLSHQDQIRLVREEAYVLGLERVIIPLRCVGSEWSEECAFQYALRELCTSAARGWFRDFAIENYPEISQYDKDFYAEFSRAEKTGLLIKTEALLSQFEFIEKLKVYIEKLEKKNRNALLLP